MNLADFINDEYENYAKHMILAFFKDTTDFASILNQELNLVINFYSSKPTFTWFNQENKKLVHNKEPKPSTYDRESFEIIFDYLANFVKVDDYDRIMKLKITPDFATNLTSYADENLTQEALTHGKNINYLQLSQNHYHVYNSFLMAEFFEKLTNLVKEVNMKEVAIDFVSPYHHEKFDYPTDDNDIAIYTEEIRAKFDLFIDNYPHHVLELVHERLKKNVFYQSKNDFDFEHNLLLTQNFEHNLETHIIPKYLVEFKTHFEKRQLEENIAQASNNEHQKGVKLKI